jgi:hypothetical protein
MGFAGVDSWILGNLVPAMVKASIKLNEALHESDGQHGSTIFADRDSSGQTETQTFFGFRFSFFAFLMGVYGVHCRDW